MTASVSRQNLGATQRTTTFSIGQVLAKLTPEFPDLSPSKLRFLEDRELVTPGRTPAGYRTYTVENIERLRFVLTVQRDHYLPLKVIKGYLLEMDQGKKPVMPNGNSAVTVVASSSASKYSRAELLAASGAKPTTLEGAITAGLISAKNVFASQDLIVLNSIVEAGAFGLEPRHLRGMRLAVDREVGLISQAVTASSNGKISPAELKDKGRELSEILTTLRSVLTKDALDQLES